MEEAKGIEAPMLSHYKSSKYGIDTMHDPLLYQVIVGTLQYVTLHRPDTAFCVNEACQFMSNPLDNIWSMVKRILRYLS